MKQLLIGSMFVLAGCASLDDSYEDEGEVESESVPTSTQGQAGQGSSMQGSSMQGSSMQGSSMQGSSMQGSSMQGSFAGGTVSYASVQGTSIVFWKKVGSTWQQRFPNKICYWNSKRTVLSYCTKYLLTQSPLLTSVWPSTFVKRDAQGNITETIPVNLTIQGVSADTSEAMFALNGSGATGAIVPCENPWNCRSNSDLLLYNVMTDVKDTNGNFVNLCPAGQSAMALAGTWDHKGVFTPSTTTFTFACTNGTIAKCTRWGYRPWASAIKTNDSVATPLTEYHSACIHAASADYCGIGRSFTKDGTLVDISDFNFPSDKGFIPRLRGFLLTWESSTGVQFEAEFDKKGALRIDFARYAELAIGPNAIEAVCPGTFDTDPAPELEYPYQRFEPLQGQATVSIDTTTACSHSELTVGKWLHSACSYCTGHVPLECNDPANGWTQACVDYVKANMTYSYQVCYGAQRRGAIHSECAVGSGLQKYDSGCTLKVCLSNPSCCTSAGWTQACVDAANSSCSGGREGTFAGRGFCGTSLFSLPGGGGIL